ncbi:MAG: hypothetical protein WBL11_06880 [Bacteroidales bacterium]|jgi:hypothetical protein|nr:hypothetical protein [Bacteroidales bacterium]MDI9575152.1 hypothetical protein [Bacteroidota bacterium]MDD2592963.1 hypothetical protein [Bacteroidales bacterium]MDD3755732.1 hypothetical protein [Bacteroidales bacterium]MDY0400817.1 hypothetical protein [Bacteroidales bacterium]
MTERCCLECGEPLVGRSDKKFCDDQCRNAYNNRLNRDSINIYRKINNKLRKNRRIISELNKTGKTKIKIEALRKKGFDFKYHTHILNTAKGTTYFFCYDMGYLIIDNEYALLVYDKEIKEDDNK